MWALESGGAGKTSVLTYTMPFWLLLMAWLVLGAVGMAAIVGALMLMTWAEVRRAGDHHFRSDVGGAS